MDPRGLVCAHVFKTDPSMAFGSGGALIIATFIASVIATCATVRKLLKNPRTRLPTLLTMVAGCIVVGGLVMHNWATIRDHAGAWWFQLTRETAEMPPTFSRGWLISHSLGEPFILDRAMLPRFTRELTDWGWRPPTLQDLRASGYRILEQRFPRPAYVVTGYPSQ